MKTESKFSQGARKRRKRRRPARSNPLDRSAPEYEHLRALSSLLPEDRVRELAKSTGLIRRERKIDPVAILWVLVLGFGVRLQTDLAALNREYRRRTGVELSDGSWYERFTPQLSAFLRESAVLAIERLAAEARGKLGDRLKQFKDLMIQDSTVIRLHEKLANVFPATRARGVAAGAKVSLLISAVANGPKKVAVSGERTADVKMLTIGPWVKDCILLVDLGYYKYQLFARIAENGGYFVTRLKDNANPLIVASHAVHRGRAIDVAGKQWQEVLLLLRRRVTDIVVEISFSRRKYRGKGSRDTMLVRLVAVWNEEARQYHVYLTNIAPDVLDAEEVADLYVCRWEIELTFKALKSHYALDRVKSTSRHVVEALIWTALLTMLVSRRYYNFIRSITPKRDRPRLTRLRWAKVFAEGAQITLHNILWYLGLARTPWEAGMLEQEVKRSQALDPHINRKRMLNGWVA